MWILHLSDVHLALGENHKIRHDLFLKLMSEKIEEFVAMKDKIVVIICGDIIYKGDASGYGLATCFFQKMKEIFGYQLMFCPCPGNHDITSDKPNCFHAFNKFVWDLTNETIINFSVDATAVCRSIEDIDFVLVNSAYHGQHTYGCVNLDNLEAILKNSKSCNKIIITHHNLIPVNSGDRSTIVNAYRLLQLALAYDVKAILHGHGHMENILLIGGKKCRLIGVGSLFFPPEDNLNNQFNLVKYANGSITEAYAYRYIGDLHGQGRVGDFQKERLNEL